MHVQALSSWGLARLQLRGKEKAAYKEAAKSEKQSSTITFETFIWGCTGLKA